MRCKRTLGAILPLHDFGYHARAPQPRGLLAVAKNAFSANEPVAYGRFPSRVPPTGGARRDRTDDLLLAKQALSQLSYGPSGDQ
jgi:hypothetical protein